MANKVDDAYLLSRNQDEKNRLDNQHSYMVRTLNYLIHPLIRSKLSDSPRIADVATGTAAWLIDVAKYYSSSAILDGFDYSDSQFTNASQLPGNVTLHVADAKKPFPSKFHGVFDVVHVRLLFTALDPEDWPVVTQNLVQLLKPGGALQWTESNCTMFLPVLRGSDDPLASIENLQALISRTWTEDVIYRRSGGPTGGWDSVKDLFEEHGLVNVIKDVFSSDRNGQAAREESTRLVIWLFQTSFEKSLPQEYRE